MILCWGKITCCLFHDIITFNIGFSLVPPAYQVEKNRDIDWYRQCRTRSVVTFCCTKQYCTSRPNFFTLNRKIVCRFMKSILQLYVVLLFLYDYGTTLLVHYFFYMIEWYNAMIMITEAPLMLSFCYVTSKENGTSELEQVSVDIALFIVFAFVFIFVFTIAGKN